jgi:predicted RNA-binding Zn-ribbon protein involved in translation (DUF1610 family)
MIAGIVAALGLLLSYWGWRGRRINDHPTCSRCGYDLSGLTVVEKCPECGRDLNARRAISRGRRARRRWAIGLGLLVLFAAGVPLWQGLAHVRWIRRAPAWVLEALADGSSSQVVAINEARRRVNLLSLDNSQVRRLADIGLKVQADRNAAWFTEWGDFLEDAWANQLLSKDQMQRYLRQSTVEGFTFVHRPQVIQGSNITMRVESPRCRMGAGVDTNMYVLVWHMESFTLGDKETRSRWGFTMPRMASYVPMPMRGSGPQIAADLLPGRYPLKVRFHVGLLETSDRNGHSAVLRQPGWPKDTMIDWMEELTSEIEILPPDARLIEVVDDQTMLEELRQGLTISDGAILIHRRGDHAQIRSHVELPPPPMDLAWQCWLDIDGTQLPAGVQSFSAGQSDAWLVLHSSDIPPDATRCHVIIEADVTVAEESIDIGNRILGGKIVLDDVPIAHEEEEE